jgi:NAD(P)-dependent dehydrogenase (short-subunit alcohol dehydrogenase family)
MSAQIRSGWSPCVEITGNTSYSFEALPAEQWRRLIDVNLNGVINVTQTFLPVLKRSAATRTTDLVNVSSIAGDRFLAGMGTYGASKAALTYLSRALRMEVAGDGIRVTNLEPGMTGGTELADETCRR